MHLEQQEIYKTRIRLASENAVNKHHNLNLANIFIAKEKQFKDKIESCNREMQLLGAVIAQQQHEIKQLKEDGSVKEQTIIDLGKRAAAEPMVEQVAEKVKAQLNKRERKQQRKKLVLPSVGERRAAQARRCTQLIKERRDELPGFHDIVCGLLAGRQP